MHPDASRKTSVDRLPAVVPLPNPSCSTTCEPIYRHILPSSPSLPSKPKTTQAGLVHLLLAPKEVCCTREIPLNPPTKARQGNSSKQKRTPRNVSKYGTVQHNKYVDRVAYFSSTCAGFLVRSGLVWSGLSPVRDVGDHLKSELPSVQRARQHPLPGLLRPSHGPLDHHSRLQNLSQHDGQDALPQGRVAEPRRVGRQVNTPRIPSFPPLPPNHMLL